jgi:hypothetical protein
MEHLEAITHEPDEVLRRLHRDWWLASILLLGEFLATIYVLVKFHLPDMARIVLGCVLLALPVVWNQSYGQLHDLLLARDSQTPQAFKLAHKLFVLSVSRPCGILTLMLFAIAYTSRFH